MTDLVLLEVRWDPDDEQTVGLGGGQQLGDGLEGESVLHLEAARVENVQRLVGEQQYSLAGGVAVAVKLGHHHTVLTT